MIQAEEATIDNSESMKINEKQKKNDFFTWFSNSLCPRAAEILIQERVAQEHKTKYSNVPQTKNLRFLTSLQNKPKT